MFGALLADPTLASVSGAHRSLPSWLQRDVHAYVTALDHDWLVAERPPEARFWATARRRGPSRCSPCARRSRAAAGGGHASPQAGAADAGNRHSGGGPARLAEGRPDAVPLFVPDLLAEVRDAYPEVETAGGRWVDAETLGSGSLQ